MCVCSVTLYILEMGLIPLSNTFDAILEQQVSEIDGADAINSCTRCEQLAEKMSQFMTVQENDEYSCCWPCNVRFFTTENVVSCKMK